MPTDGVNDNKPRRAKQPSIDQVALRAGVSTATVSRVLNNPSLVTPATAKRVERAIQELKYRPNMFAKGLMTRSSRVLALVLPDIHGEFYSELLRGADAHAHERGYHLLASSRTPLEGPTNAAPAAFGLLDGVILMLPSEDQRILKRAYTLDLPLVLIEVDGSKDGFDSVLIDNQPGAREATEHILSQCPPERCMYVGGDPSNADTKQRIAAFREALKAAGAEPRDSQIVLGSYDSSFGERWALKQGADRLKGLGIVAGNDEIAFGIMAAAGQLGLSFPDDLRIVGFDNTRLSSLIRPRLSSVRVPLAQIGAEAVQMLIGRIEGETEARERPPRVVRIPTELVTRETS